MGSKQGAASIAKPSRFWDQLIQLIEEGRVVPIVGQDLLTVPETTGRKLMYPFLADKLAGYLEVNTDDLPEGWELNEVACRYLKAGNGKPQEIYAALKTVWTEAAGLPISEPLLQLAAIRPFKLFVSTTFDPSLSRAIDQKRFGGNPRTKVLAHAPNEIEDLTTDLASLTSPVVYQVMGKLSAIPAYAVTQGDLIEFFHSLQSENRPKQLFHEVSSRSLLMLGTRLSGWLTSFMMRMAKNQPLSSDDKTNYVADGTVSNDKNLVLFLERFASATKIYSDSDPVGFVNELYNRWIEKYPETGISGAEQADTVPAGSDLPAGAVFLSYASEDRLVVENIKQALDQAGVDAFFDKEQLQAGDDWKGKLQRNIHGCSLFVPVISRQTLTPERRFFRVEWDLALEEAQMAAADTVFLLPVVIDDTPIDNPALPSKFKAVQATPLPGGVPSANFLNRVRDLYRKQQIKRSGGGA